MRKRPPRKKKFQKGIELMDTDTHIDPKLLKEWQQFDSNIRNTESLQGFSTPETTTTQKIARNMVSTEGTSGPPMTQKYIEIIPEYPSNEIVLCVEEIPPLDVFYNAKHSVIVKRQRKKRNLDQSSLLPTQMEKNNVVSREELNPFEDITKLSEYTGAYSVATMDKVSNVNNFLKEKDQTIVLLEA